MWRMKSTIAQVYLNKNHGSSWQSFMANNIRISTDSGGYIKFHHTDLESSSGFSQEAVPYWEAQDIATTPVTALVGAGFAFKAHDNSGGFIGPVVVPFHEVKHVELLTSRSFEILITKYLIKYRYGVEDQ